MALPPISSLPPLPAECWQLLETLAEWRDFMPVRQWRPDQFTEICEVYDLIGMVNQVRVITGGLTHQDGRDRTGFCWALQTQGRRALVDRGLRQQADAQPAGGLADEATEPLTEAQQQVHDLIVEHGPLTARQIVNRLGTVVGESTLTRHYIPAVKRHGIKNRRGLGYYHPDHYKPD